MGEDDLVLDPEDLVVVVLAAELTPVSLLSESLLAVTSTGSTGAEFTRCMAAESSRVASHHVHVLLLPRSGRGRHHRRINSGGLETN